MGFMKPDTSAIDKANALAEEQIRKQEEELRRKRDALFQERLGIIKSQGAPQWTPDTGGRKPTPQPGNTPLME